MGEGSREQRLQSGSVGCCLCVGLYLHPHCRPSADQKWDWTSLLLSREPEPQQVQ